MYYNNNLEKQNQSGSLNKRSSQSQSHSYSAQVYSSGNISSTDICSSKIFHELTSKLQQIGKKIKNQGSIEELMMLRFQDRAEDSSNVNQTLQDCLQFCVEEYHIKQQHLQIAFQIATHFQRIIENLTETNYEQAHKIQIFEEQVLSHSHESKQLHSCIQQLEKQLQAVKNRSHSLIVQYESQKDDLNVKNQVFKEVLRETYESDREELGEVVKELQWEIQRRGRQIEDYKGQVHRFQSQMKNKQKIISQLKQQNDQYLQKIVQLKQQIALLVNVSEKTILNKEKLQIKQESLQEKQKYLQKAGLKSLQSYKLSDFIENKNLPLQISKQEDNTPTKTKLRKVNSRSADKDKNHSQVVVNIKPEKKNQQGSNKSEQFSKKKSIKKMKSLAFHPETHQTLQSLYQQCELRANNPIPYSIVNREAQNNQSAQKNNNILERCLYKVKSIERFSQVSQIGRFSNSLYFNLGQIQKQTEPQIKNQTKAQKKAKNISIGFNTQPNQQDQFSLDSPVSKRYNLRTSRSFQSHSYFDDPIIEETQNNPTTAQALNTKIKEIFSNLVSKRTHKKKQGLTISQIQQKRKAEKQARQNLSKSFYSTMRNIKQSFIGPQGQNIVLKKTQKSKNESSVYSPTLHKKAQHKKNLSTSMINFSSPYYQKLSVEAEPARNMKKSKNTSIASPLESKGQNLEGKKNGEQKQGQKSNFLSSIFNFAVKNRIKRN